MVKYEVNFKGKLAGGSGFMQFVLRGVFRSTRVQLGSSITGGEVGFWLYSGARVSSIPCEQSSRDLYSIKTMRVNRQSHCRSGRREQNRTSTLSCRGLSQPCDGGGCHPPHGSPREAQQSGGRRGVERAKAAGTDVWGCARTLQHS